MRSHNIAGLDARPPVKKPRLVCLGDLMLDVVVRPSSAIESGTDVPGAIRFRAGGSAANTCRSFVALGGSAGPVPGVKDALSAAT